MTYETPGPQKRSPDWESVYSGSSGAIPWNSNKPDPELTELVESGRIHPHFVLDVGCGTGTDAIYLASKGANVTAIDISREAIRIAGEKAEKAGVKVDFVVGDFLTTEFDDTMFDFANDRGCFHIINPARRGDFATKVNRLLREGGFYYLRCWSDRQPFESEMTPYRISKDIIHRTFAEFFDVGEIRDFRWGGKGPWGYFCLISKKKQR